MGVILLYDNILITVLAVVAYGLGVIYYIAKFYKEFKTLNWKNTKDKILLGFNLVFLTALFIIGYLLIKDNQWMVQDAVVIALVLFTILLFELYLVMACEIVRLNPSVDGWIFKKIASYKIIARYFDVVLLLLLLSYFGIKKYFPLESGVSERLIVVESDYGENGGYEGDILGLIQGVNSKSKVHFLTSHSDPLDIRDAAWKLWRSSRYFKEGTIFLVLTNPGGRVEFKDHVVLETNNGLIFIGVDKGLFDYVVHYYGCKRFVAISNEKYQLNNTVSDGVGGTNDLLAPIAAELSNGMGLKQIGKIQSGGNYKYKLTGSGFLATVQNGGLTCSVMSVDNFSNVNLNVDTSYLMKANMDLGGSINISFKDTVLKDVPIERFYDDVRDSGVVAILDGDILQLAINKGRFADKFHIGKGQQLILKIAGTGADSNSVPQKNFDAQPFLKE